MPLIITGTDTNLGKTMIAAWICLHTKASYWKPLQSGIPGDREVVESLAGVHTYPEAYRFTDCVSPHAAANREGVCIDEEALTLPNDPRLIIEGSGGVLGPVTPHLRVIDFIKRWQAPVVVVARSTLGTINHTCMTLEALRSRDIPIRGVVLNGLPNPSNKQAIEDYGKCPVIAEFPVLKVPSREALAAIPLPEALKDI